MGAITTYPAVAAQAPNTPITLGYAQIIASILGYGTTATDVTGLSLTVVVPEGRRLRVSAFAIFQKQTTTQFTRMYLFEGSTMLTESILTKASGEYFMMQPSVVLSPTAGMHTYNVKVDCGSGTVDLNAGATIPAYILVEDITGMPTPAPPASVPAGVLAYAQVTANQTASANNPGTDIAGLSVNVVVPAGRTIRVTAHLTASYSTTGQVNMRIIDSVVGSVKETFATIAPSVNTPFTGIGVYSPSAGAHVIKVTLGQDSGAGTVTMLAGSVYPAYVLVEDITATPAPASSAPSSTLGYAEVVANQAGITTTVDLTGLSVTVTVPAGRRIRVTGRMFAHSSVTTDEGTLRLKEGTTDLQLDSQIINANWNGQGMTVIWVGAPAAGAHTYKLQYGRVAGSGTHQLIASAAVPAFILVEDITANSMPVPASTGLWQPGSQYPVAPQIGDMFYDINLGKLMAYGPTGWRAVSGGNAATLAYAQVTTNQLGISTEVDLTGLSVTVTVPAGRRLRLTAQGYFVESTGNGRGIGRFKEGSTELGRWADFQAYIAGAIQRVGGSVVVSPTAGTHTYKLTANATAGTTDSLADPTYPAFFLVEDITGDPAPYPPVSVPVGQLGYGVNVAQQNSIGTTETATNIPGVNVVVPAGRVLKVTVHFSLVVNNPPQSAITRIYEDGVAVRKDHLLGTNASAEVLEWSWTFSPSAGSHTYTATLATTSGTIHLQSGAYIRVEDITPTPAPANTAPSSTLGYAEVVASQTGITAEVDLANLAVTVTVPAGRRLRISAAIWETRSVADGLNFLKIKEGATTLQTDSKRPSTTDSINVETSVVVSPSAGSHTYKLTLARTSGTGTVTMDAGVTFPAYILVEDITGVSTPLATQYNPPSCRVFHNVDQSLVANNSVAIAFGGERFDPNSMHDTVTLNTRITIVTPGLYMVGFNGKMEIVTDYTYIRSTLRLNGTTEIANVLVGNINSVDFNYEIAIHTVWKFNAGDWVEILVRHKNAANAARLMKYENASSPEFWAVYIGSGN